MVSFSFVESKKQGVRTNVRTFRDPNLGRTKSASETIL
jgi:hypothetical protein